MFDGETVSLAPSVGNWSYPCRSRHYNGAAPVAKPAAAAKPAERKRKLSSWLRKVTGPDQD